MAGSRSPPAYNNIFQETTTFNTRRCSDSRQKVQTCFSQNGACVVGKMIPHPVGVFCTHLEAPKCHIEQKSNLGRIFFEIFRIFEIFGIFETAQQHSSTHTFEILKKSKEMKFENFLKSIIPLFTAFLILWPKRPYFKHI